MKKQVISPGQGLLLLIDHYKDDAIKTAQLKKLYLSGVITRATGNEMKTLLKDPVLDSYQLSTDIQTINNDPTRRYFETHLAYESLVHNLDHIEYDDLKQHVDKLTTYLPIAMRTLVEHVLNGDFKSTDSDLFKEYAEYIRKIKFGELFNKISPTQRDKIELLAKISVLGVFNVQSRPLPLDIYGSGVFSEANKGKELKSDQESSRSQNLGLMKSYMPLAPDDIARSDKEIPHLKPSDQASFVKNASWVRSNFSRMVHPYSNSASGTMLCQLRVLAESKNKGETTFMESAERIALFSRLLTSTMLFYSGGHTLHEFITPITLKKVREEFHTIPKFNSLNLESIYLDSNEKAFDTALQDAILYNNNILMRQRLQEQIKDNISTLKKVP